MPLWLCLVGRLCVPHSVISTLSYFVQLYHLDYFDGRSNLDYVHKRTTVRGTGVHCARAGVNSVFAINFQFR